MKRSSSFLNFSRQIENIGLAGVSKKFIWEKEDCINSFGEKVTSFTNKVHCNPYKISIINDQELEIILLRINKYDKKNEVITAGCSEMEDINFFANLNFPTCVTKDLKLISNPKAKLRNGNFKEERQGKFFHYCDESPLLPGVIVDRLLAYPEPVYINDILGYLAQVFKIDLSASPKITPRSNTNYLVSCKLNI